jgi:hypothetical protein
MTKIERRLRAVLFLAIYISVVLSGFLILYLAGQ